MAETAPLVVYTGPNRSMKAGLMGDYRTRSCKYSPQPSLPVAGWLRLGLLWLPRLVLLVVVTIQIEGWSRQLPRQVRASNPLVPVNIGMTLSWPPCTLFAAMFMSSALSLFSIRSSRSGGPGALTFILLCAGFVPLVLGVTAAG